MADDVSVKLGLNAHDAKKELTDVEKLFQGFGAKIGKGLTSLSAGFAGFFAVSKITDAVTSTIHYGSTIQDLSERFHVGTSAIQRYKLAAEQSGTSLEVFSKAFQKLNLNRSKALDGDHGARQKFQDVGISLDDLKTKSPEQIFDAIARSGADAAQQVAIMGKNAQELGPLFDAIESGSAKLNNFVISPENIKRLDDLEDLFLALAQGALSLSATVIGTLIPAFEKFFTFIGEGQRLAAKPFEAITRTFGGADTAGILTNGADTADAGERSLNETLKRHLHDAGLNAVPDTTTEGPAEEEARKDTGFFALDKEEQKDIDKETLDIGAADTESKLDRAKEAADQRDEAEKSAEDKKQKAETAKEKLRQIQFKHDNDEAVRNPGGLTLHDIATSNVLGPERAKAQEAERAEADAKRHQLSGEKGLAQQDRARADKLKEQLGVKGPKDEFKDALNESEVLKKIEKNTGGGAPNK